MFGAQPPVHIVAPAPIHPASASALPSIQQILSRQQSQQQSNIAAVAAMSSQSTVTQQQPQPVMSGHQQMIATAVSQHQQQQQQSVGHALPPAKVSLLTPHGVDCLFLSYKAHLTISVSEQCEYTNHFGNQRDFLRVTMELNCIYVTTK